MSDNFDREDVDFDARARAAGRALRQPAPPNGLALVRGARRRRALYQTGAGFAVVAVAIAAVVIVRGMGDDQTSITSSRPDSTMPATTQPVPTPPGTSVPGTNPALNPETIVSPVAGSTSLPATSEVPVSTDGPLVGGTGTLWFRSYLIGQFVDGEFEASTVPTGVVGSEIELLGVTGDRRSAAAVECAFGEIQVTPGVVSGSQMSEIWRTAGLSLASAPPDTDAGLAEMEADLAALGINPAASVSYGNEFAADGSIDRLVLVDGRATSGVTTPTWIATWNATTGEFTTIEGDPDPAQALSIGSVDPTWLDLDRDGNWEMAYAFGDAILVQELATKDIIMATGAHLCTAQADQTQSAALAGWNWDNSGIDRVCGDVWWEQQQVSQLRCTQVVIDPQGVPVSYDPLTRRVTREHRTGVEPVAFVLPDDYVDPSLLAAGPDDVVYFALDNDWPSPSDVIAMSLAPGDAGRMIERFPTVLAIGDADVLAAPTGLVVSGWYDPGSRPSYDATPVVAWVDRNGGVAAPTTAGAFDDANNTISANGWQWDIAGRQVIPEQPGSSMVVPTFDGGFIAAYTETTGSARTEVVRGWRDGTVEHVELPLSSPALVLEPQGTLLVPNGDSFARIAPVEDPATGWDGNLQIDVAGGTATPVGLDEYLDTIDWPAAGQSHLWPWGTSPIAFANAVAGGSPTSPSELRTIQQEPAEGSTVVVTVTTEGFLDDSVHGTRLTMHISLDQPGFRILRIDWSNTCQPDRGHQDYRAEYCI
jgi:hypothetical protein